MPQSAPRRRQLGCLLLLDQSVIPATSELYRLAADLRLPGSSLKSEHIYSIQKHLRKRALFYMASMLSWLDHDRAASERSMRMLSFFKEREARDELGIGGIRDAIADQLFPGTSTIQTRLRYVFFIPWLYSQLEKENTSSSKYPSAAREAESRLLQALLDNEPETETGIIGREAKSTLKRLPSSVYWAGLGSWGIYKGGETLQQYFAQADRRRALRSERRRRDDGDVHDSDAAGHAWDLQAIRLRSEAFPADTRLSLTRDESAFLLDRWSKSQRNSLLTWLALDLRDRKVAPNPDRIWAHPGFADFPVPMKELVVHGRWFDALTRGAALLYNLQLAEKDKRDKLVSDYTAQFSQWAESELPDCADWSLDSFWPRVLDQGHTITSDTQRFVESWRELAIAGIAVAGGSAAARQLIQNRESKLKGARSRFTNQAALKQWGGAAGTAPLTYRWPIAKSMLKEWHMGWLQR